MAKARTARCPDCSHDRETRAQPRTVLRCPGCGEHYLAPPLDGPPLPREPAPLPVATDEEMAESGMLGPEVVRLDTLTFPPADVHPAASDPPHDAEAEDTDPAPADRDLDRDAPPAPAAGPDPPGSPPEPAQPPVVGPDPVGSPPSGPRRRRGYARW